MIARVLFCVVALSSLAHADDTASSLFKEGVEQLRGGNLPVAADRFKRSQALEPRAATMCNLALTYERWPAHESEAIAAYKSCAELDGSGRFQAHARERARAIEADLIAHPRPKLPPDPTPTPTPASEPAPPAPTPEPTVVAPEPPPSPPSRGSRRLLWASLGTAVGALATLGVGLALVETARSDTDQLEKDHGTVLPPGSAAANELDHLRARAYAGAAFYGVAAALGVTSISLLIADRVDARALRVQARGASLAVSF